MHKKQPNVKDNFLYPITAYRGSINNDTVLFNEKLQAFAQKVGFIANLYTGGKLPSKEAYSQVESLWRELESTGTMIHDSCDR
ncbi:MAG: hypothetical protein AB4063_01975 [Crocosphaera sp.]